MYLEMLRGRHIDASSRSCKRVAFSRYGIHVALVIDYSPVNINIFSVLCMRCEGCKSG